MQDRLPCPLVGLGPPRFGLSGVPRRGTRWAVHWALVPLRSLLPLLPLLAGCGSAREETAPVSGQVTWQGKPVTQGQILFMPESGRLAYADLSADGRYELTTFVAGDGAVLGEHRVAIVSTLVGGQPPTSLADELGGGGRMPVAAESLQWIVPEEYSEVGTSPLKAQVVRGQNRCDFHLP